MFSWFPTIKQHFGFVVFLDEHKVFAVGAPVCADAGKDVNPAGVLDATPRWAGIKNADFSAVAQTVDPDASASLPAPREGVTACRRNALGFLAGPGVKDTVLRFPAK